MNQQERDEIIFDAREEATAWAYSYKGRKFVIFDTETTGIGDDDEVIQIAAIHGSGKELLNIRVKPIGKTEWPEAQEVHGISPEDVADCKTIDALFDQLSLIFSDTNVLAYNMEYDKRIMAQSFGIAGLEEEWGRVVKSSTWECVMLQAAKFVGDWLDYRQSFKWPKLINICKDYDVPVENVHDALGDIKMTLSLFNVMYSEGELPF